MDSNDNTFDAAFVSSQCGECTTTGTKAKRGKKHTCLGANCSCTKTLDPDVLPKEKKQKTSSDGGGSSTDVAQPVVDTTALSTLAQISGTLAKVPDTPKAKPSKPAKHLCTYKDCEKAFVRSNDLKRHLCSHTGQKSRKCSHPGCTKSYSSSTALRYHLSTHNGLKPINCEFPGCDKTFALSYVMKQHLPSHTGDKPFKCDVDGCEKAYVASSGLIQHKRKHTGEKPFKCTEPGCSKAYVSQSGLIPHLKKHKSDDATTRQLIASAV